MTAHVTALAALHGIDLRWTNKSWRSSHSYPGARLVTVTKIKKPAHYLIALHEIGHVVSPLALGLVETKGREATVLCEGAAWAWAAEHAKPSLLRAVRKSDWLDVGYAFTTYMR